RLYFYYSQGNFFSLYSLVQYKLHTMKNLRFLTVALAVMMLLSSCGMFSNLFKKKTGCPTNGKNVGAEKILSGDPDGTKAAKKAKKFRS
ncbi:MAG TPA: hypothetical protein PLO99_15525, partial [Chitinophagaceae bacterium]|nr:hypothetical protein [Chitinophagaceae bacterium]